MICGTAIVGVRQPAGGATSSSPAQAEAIRAVDEAEAAGARLQAIHAATMTLHFKMSSFYESLSKKISEAGTLAQTPGVSQAQLIQSMRQLDQLQTSFNLQYLELQRQIRVQNQEFNAVSNILKAKHDTVKNSISNIR